MTARENLEKLRLQKGIPDRNRVEEVLKIVGLENTGKKEVKNFSLGMRQRLGIANILLSRPGGMVMDEPINGLDPEGIIEIRELLLKLNREEHITIIISSHILSELSLLCTDYIFIHHGEIIQNITAEELRNCCKESYHIDTDQNSVAAALLQEKLGITDFSVEEDGSIQVYERLDELKLISRTLSDNGVIPIGLSMRETNLEKYYMDMGDMLIRYMLMLFPVIRLICGWKGYKCLSDGSGAFCSDIYHYCIHTDEYALCIYRIYHI